jgi:hypothetical protein
MSTRENMEGSLKATVVPVLRSLGFKGSFPHFFREQHGHIDLACFQFSMSGGKFVVELSFATPNRANVYINTDVSASKLRVSQTTNRLRLGAAGEHGDNWFIFDPASAGADITVEQISSQVAALLECEGVAWWNSKRNAGQRIRLDRAQPRSEPFVGRARS